MGPVIHIVDDDKSFRTAVGRLLEASGYRVVGYASGTEVLASLRLDEPGCILLDLQMPGLNGLELQQRLREEAPLLPIVFVSGHGSIEATVHAVKAGAEDFLEKPFSEETLLEAIKRAVLRCEQQRAEHARLLAYKNLAATMSPRESEVLGLLIRGKRNKQIAYEIGTTERTVKAHRRSIMEKLGVRSFAELVSLAERLGFLNAEEARR
jgi:FixJ family two-component response regulator